MLKYILSVCFNEIKKKKISFYFILFIIVKVWRNKQKNLYRYGFLDFRLH